MKRLVVLLSFLLALLSVSSEVKAQCDRPLSHQELTNYFVMDAGNQNASKHFGRTEAWLRSQGYDIEIKTHCPEQIVWADSGSGNEEGRHYTAPSLAPGTTLLVNRNNNKRGAILWSASSVRGTTPGHEYQQEGGLNIVLLQNSLGTETSTNNHSSVINTTGANNHSDNNDTYESSEVIDGGHVAAQIPIYIDRISGVQYSEEVKLVFAKFIQANFPNYKIVGSRSQAKYYIQLVGGYKSRENENRLDKKQAITNGSIRGGDRVGNIIVGRTRNRVDDDVYNIYRGVIAPIFVDPKVKNPNNQIRKFEFGFTIDTYDSKTRELFSEAYSPANFEFTYKENKITNVSGDIPPDADLTNASKTIELGSFHKTLNEMLAGTNFTIKP